MTPHNEAKKEEIAKIVIMPGDPLRAKFIAETYLQNVKLVNQVRGMYAYTGTYKNKEVTIMASGMGMPSMGIYSYELFTTYDVDTIIRIGSCGAYTSELNLYDLILVAECYSESTYAKMQSGDSSKILSSTPTINEMIKNTANKLSFPLHVGTVYSSDVFYYQTPFDFRKLYQEHGCLAVEMESFALFHNAKVCNKNAACVLTVSDNLETRAETTSEERQNSFTHMMELVLESIL